MAQTFNSPPGWPKPPEGWTPPPGWAPDPSWPAAPDGWQFWTEDPFAAAVSAENTFPSQRAQQPGQTPPGVGPGSTPDQQPTQTMGTPATQAMPIQPGQPFQQGQPGLYSYAPSGGLEQPGASPYSAQPPQQGGYPTGPAGGYAPGGPGGRTPKPRSTTTIIVVAVVAVLVLGGLVWGISSLFAGGDEEPTAVEPTTVATSDEPTDDATSEEPTSDEPTTEEPTDDATTDGGTAPAGDVVDLAPGEPAVVYGVSGEPVVEVRLVEHVVGWQPAGSSTALCSDPENGQYLGLHLEFTVLAAMANEDPPHYTYIGWELGAQAGDRVIETSAFASGLFCVGSEEAAPAEMQPGETYTGLSVLDVPADVSAVTWEDLFDWSGQAPLYRWVLADQ